MLFSTSFLVFFLLALTAVEKTIADDSCQTHIDKLGTCNAAIILSDECDSAIVNLTNTEYAKCKTNTFSWSHPENNMTLIIETFFTQQEELYRIVLVNSKIMTGISHVYRIINNEETEITTDRHSLVQDSDSNYQIILKFQAPTHFIQDSVDIVYVSLPIS